MTWNFISSQLVHSDLAERTRKYSSIVCSMPRMGEEVRKFEEARDLTSTLHGNLRLGKSGPSDHVSLFGNSQPPEPISLTGRTTLNFLFALMHCTRVTVQHHSSIIVYYIGLVLGTAEVSRRSNSIVPIPVHPAESTAYRNPGLFSNTRIPGFRGSNSGIINFLWIRPRPIFRKIDHSVGFLIGV